jgi:hypothetical protein
MAGQQVSNGLDIVTDLAFKDSFTVQAIVITANSIVTVVGLSALALRLTRSGFLARILARRGLPKEGPGLWATVNESMSPRAAKYQAQISGRPGEGYIVNGVKFDGFKNGELLDAKGLGYANFVGPDGKFKPFFTGAEKLVEQAERQLGVAGNSPITWHIAEEEAVQPIRRLLEQNGFGTIRLVHTPPDL